MNKDKNEREWNGKEEMRGRKRNERGDKPLNTSDGRVVRELEPRLIKGINEKREIEDEVMEEKGK